MFRFNTSVKLLIIIPLKKYLNKDGSVKLGGYMLNDELYTESLFIDNPGLVEKLEISEKNIIYKMVDNINSVSLKNKLERFRFYIKKL